ncbi:MAG: hypothetical protein AUJ71_00815 [Candidatus Omnitrophica bacterium CG1_02_49_16]|nr:MAG: hypothetical protein AUJ71_00815 [Candidatus Omnitrophica bacterium CG1_02_49_16]
MKKYLLFLVLTVLWISTNVQAESAHGDNDIFAEMKKSYGSPKEQQEEIEKIKHVEDISALEWLQMSIGEKQDHIFASMYNLDQHGVPLHKPASYYYNLVQEKLTANPNLYDVNLTDILSSIVYEKEAGAREILDKMKQKF